MSTTSNTPNFAAELLRAAQELQRQATINAAIAAAGHAAALAVVWHRGHWRYFVIAFGVLWFVAAIRRWRAFRDLRDPKNPVANTMLSQPEDVRQIEGWPTGAKRPPFLTVVTTNGASLRIRIKDVGLVAAVASMREHFRNAVIDVVL